MILDLLSLLGAAAGLVISWVAGCMLLHTGYPHGAKGVALKLGLLGVCVYGVGVAASPLAFEMAPTLITVLWRVALAVVACAIYEHVLGWRVLARQLLQAPRRLRAWVRLQVEAGKQRRAGRPQ